MDYFDFTLCEFIQSNMSYVTYNDFCKNKKTIKTLYSNFDKNRKRFYKWYVYANIFTSKEQKNAIWEYLNLDDKEYLLNLLKYKKK